MKARCYSFHSVKGGVGKSTLALLLARGLARKSERPVFLIDLDLTGTSLADVLPLRAPSLAVDDKGRLDLVAPRRGLLDREATVDAIDAREERGFIGPGTAVGVPFLNDYLLFANVSWDEQKDVGVENLLWSYSGAASNLSVIPSSALPSDLTAIIPVIFDEEHSAFLEARLELLMSKLLSAAQDAAFVFDVPPTIPGISRAVLSMATRLSGGAEKVELSDDGGTPHEILEAEIDWAAFLVTTLDLQDVRAAARWLGLVARDDERVIRAVINRVPVAPALEVQQLVRKALRDEPNAILDRARLFQEMPDVRVFTSGEVQRDLIDRIDEVFEL